MSNATNDAETVRKNATISARILALRAAGMSAPDAVDAVLGEGTFERLAGDVYDALRAKAVRS